MVIVKNSKRYGHYFQMFIILIRVCHFDVNGELGIEKSSYTQLFNNRASKGQSNCMYGSRMKPPEHNERFTVNGYLVWQRSGVPPNFRASNFKQCKTAHGHMEVPQVTQVMVPGSQQSWEGPRRNLAATSKPSRLKHCPSARSRTSNSGIGSPWLIGK